MLLKSEGEKMGVIAHFSEIINQQYFQKALKYITMYGFFFQLET